MHHVAQAAHAANDTQAVAVLTERQRIRRDGVEALVITADQVGALAVEQILDFVEDSGVGELRRILANWKSVHAEVGGDRRRG